MTAIKERETRRQTGTWRSAILPLAIVAVNVACLVIDVQTLNAEYNWLGRYGNDCRRLVVFPWTMTLPQDAALALSALSIAVTGAWFIRRRRIGDQRGSIVFIALVLACLGALTVGLILLSMHWYAHFHVACPSGG